MVVCPPGLLVGWRGVRIDNKRPVNKQEVDMNKKEIKEKAQERTIDKSAVSLLEKTMSEGVETSWDRLEAQQPQCGFG